VRLNIHTRVRRRNYLVDEGYVVGGTNCMLVCDFRHSSRVKKVLILSAPQPLQHVFKLHAFFASYTGIHTDGHATGSLSLHTGARGQPFGPVPGCGTNSSFSLQTTGITSGH